MGKFRSYSVKVEAERFGGNAGYLDWVFDCMATSEEIALKIGRSKARQIINSLRYRSGWEITAAYVTDDSRPF